MQEIEVWHMQAPSNNLIAHCSSRVGAHITLWSPTNGSINELIKVGVVGEDDMATHVEQEALWGHVCASQAASLLSLQAGQVVCNIRLRRADADISYW